MSRKFECPMCLDTDPHVHSVSPKTHLTAEEKAVWDRAMDETYPPAFVPYPGRPLHNGGPVNKDLLEATIISPALKARCREIMENNAGAAAVGAGSCTNVSSKPLKIEDIKEMMSDGVAIQKIRDQLSKSRPDYSLEVENAAAVAFAKSGYGLTVKEAKEVKEAVNAALPFNLRDSTLLSSDMPSFGGIAHAKEGWVDQERCEDGATIFYSPDGEEAFRLCANGDFKAHGQTIPDVYGVYRRFNEWLEACGK